MSSLEFLSGFSKNSARFLFHTKGVVSLAKLQTSVLFKNKNKSFKYILKKIGSNTDSYGTPYNYSLHELKVLLILTLCFLLFK